MTQKQCLMDLILLDALKPFQERKAMTPRRMSAVVKLFDERI